MKPLRLLAFKVRGRTLDASVGSGIYLPALAAFYDEWIDVEETYLRHPGALVNMNANLHRVVDDSAQWCSRLALLSPPRRGLRHLSQRCFGTG